MFKLEGHQRDSPSNYQMLSASGLLELLQGHATYMTSCCPDRNIEIFVGEYRDWLFGQFRKSRSRDRDGRRLARLGRRGGLRLEKNLRIQRKQSDRKDGCDKNPLLHHSTGFGPAGEPGRHRLRRFSAAEIPRIAPWRATASSAYAEQLGINRHEGNQACPTVNL